MSDKADPNDELLDLVDENDKVIGEVWKSKANRDPKLIHREAAVLVYDNQGRLLLQQRSHKKIVSPGVWEITAAGHIAKGLSPEETAHKELKEELGFDVSLKFVEKYKAELPHETHFTYFFLGEYQGSPIVIQPDEVKEARLFDQEEFNDLQRSGAPIGRNSEKHIRGYWAGEFDHLLS